MVAALSSMPSALAESSKFSKRRRILSMGVEAVGREKLAEMQKSGKSWRLEVGSWLQAVGNGEFLLAFEEALELGEDLGFFF